MSNGNVLYLSCDWGLALNKQHRHTIHVLGDLLTVQANGYDCINDLFNAGRSKFTIGLGYDYVLSRNSQLSVQAKYFNLVDKATPVTQRDVVSDGYTLYGYFHFQF